MFLIQLVAGIALSIAAIYFGWQAVKVKGAKLDDIGLPRSNEGEVAPILHGTAYFDTGQILWRGDLKVRKIKSSGDLFGRQQELGERIKLGVWMAFCQSGIDGIAEIQGDGKTAWEGWSEGDDVFVDKRDLFGGYDVPGAGGMRGTAEVLMGAIDQLPTSYMTDVMTPSGLAADVSGWLSSVFPIWAATRGAITDITPAGRGLFTLMFRQFYWGNTKTLRPMRVKLVGIYNNFQDDPVVSTDINGWYPETAPVGAEFQSGAAGGGVGYDEYSWVPDWAYSWFYTNTHHPGYYEEITPADLGMTIDQWRSGSTQIRFTLSREWSGVGELIAQPVAYTGVSWLYTPPGGDPTTMNFGHSAAVPGTENGAGTAASAWYTDTGWVTLPEASTSDSVIDVITYYDAAFQTLVDYEWPLVEARISTGVMDLTGSRWIDKNPIHMGYDTLLSPRSAGSGNVAKIDDDNFRAAALRCFNEGYGFSLKNRTPTDRDAFLQLIEDHAQCRFYVDRGSGKWKVALIREVEDPESLTVFGDGGILISAWEEPLTKALPDDLPAKIALTYTSRKNGGKKTITRGNPAAARASTNGEAVPVELLGITRDELADEICNREVGARTVPLARGAMRVPYAPSELHRGWPIVIKDQFAGSYGKIFWITDIRDGDGVDNGTTIWVMEDHFSHGVVTVPETVEIGTGLDRTALPAQATLVEEIPFYVLCDRWTKALVTDRLTDDPDFGMMHATCNRPSETHTGANLWRDVSGTWLDTGDIDMASAFALRDDLLIAEETISIDYAYALEDQLELEAGLLMAILTAGHTEYATLVSVAHVGSEIVYTIKRGVIDTIPPESHAAGTWVFIFDERAETDAVEYTAGDAQDYRVTPHTSTDEIAVEDVGTKSVTFASRAIRPYPPAGLVASKASYDGSVVLSWYDRDRLSLTVRDYWDATDHGPEAGTTYRLDVTEYEGDGVTEVTTATATVTSPHNYTTAVSAGTAFAKFTVTSVRGGYDSWQSPSVTLPVSTALLMSGDFAGEAIETSGDEAPDFIEVS